MEASPLDSVSEITIMPDGRVYVFGAMRPVLELLGNLGSNERVERLLDALRRQDDGPRREEHEKIRTEGGAA